MRDMKKNQMSTQHSSGPRRLFCDLTQTERQKAIKAACQRWNADFQRPEMKAAIEKILSDFDVTRKEKQS
jgi:hypothetical protein